MNKKLGVGILFLMLLLPLATSTFFTLIEREQARVYRQSIIGTTPCSYMISANATIYAAQNCQDSSILFSSTDAKAVINDAIGNLTGGGKIFIKAGIYTLNPPAPFSLGGNQYAAIGAMYGPNNIEIYGEGNATILRAGTNLNARMLQGFYVNGWNIHDLQVDGNADNQNEGGGTGQCAQVGIMFSHSNNSTIHHTYVHDTKTYGIDVNFGNDIKIEDNAIRNINANGIIVYGGSGYVITGNVINGASDVGISISGAQYPYTNITNVICERNIISNMNLRLSPFNGGNWGLGIAIGDNGPAAGVDVSHNIIYSTKGSGIGAGVSSTVMVCDVTIAFNSLYWTGGGIASYYVRNLLVSSNFIQMAPGLKYVPLNIEHGFGTNIIINNQLFVPDFNSNTIVTLWGLDRVTFAANYLEFTVMGNNAVGVAVTGTSYARILNNVISDRSKHSLGILLRATNHTNVTGNTILTANTGIAESEPNSDYNLIEGNLISVNNTAMILGGNRTIAINNPGYNPVGRITKFVYARGGGTTPGDGNYFSPRGTSSNLVASTTYTISNAPCRITILSAGSASITLNGGTAFAPTVGESWYLYPGETINFGAFASSPPTLQVDFT